MRSAAEALVDVDATTSMMVTIYNGAGAVVAGPTAATKTAVGIYQYVVTSTLTATLDQYRVLWEWTQDTSERKATSYYEVVGAYYFPLAEVRELAGMTTPTAQQITDARERIEELIENRHKRAYVPRGRRVTLDGDSSYELSLPDLRITSIYSISVTDSAGTVTAFTPAELADVRITSYGYIRRKSLGYWASGHGNVSVHYVTGEAEAPDPIKRAALLMCQASFILVDGEGNPTRPLESVLMDIPEAKELLEGWADNYVGVG